MSKVIDELIRKATVEVPHERQWDATIQVFDKKLFAELLIKECARVAGDAEENEKSNVACSTLSLNILEPLND